MENDFGPKRATPVPFEVSGRPDGVEAAIDCVVTRFNLDCHGKPVNLKTYPSRYECTAIASHSNGTVSFSIKGVGEMFTVRLEDLADLLRVAKAASGEDLLQQ